MSYSSKTICTLIGLSKNMPNRNMRNFRHNLPAIHNKGEKWVMNRSLRSTDNYTLKAMKKTETWRPPSTRTFTARTELLPRPLISTGVEIGRDNG
ncbi:hypothetical protein SLEP1_g24097 [Rubroshorea leprosula]|uniref:Uncharacterized protein n=1 Tax=Rubroshorea leprosula TaxID=152421 RepID=A0AAV5JQI2_9ROSI|nr:hypothetical protein SLEP1_g24097 [Rubroshorea leprosula]